jgi:hypothetical protein
MKRSIPFVIGILLAAFLSGTNALTQQDLNDRGQPRLNAKAVANSYINNHSRHKLILRSEDIDVYNDLISKAAIVEEIDYGSFKLVIVDEDAAGGRAALRALSAPVRDDENLILFNGYHLDTTHPEVTYARIPGDLRQTDMINAVYSRSRPRGGLYIVQFVGPIKDEWLDQIKSAGAEIVTYIPSNAYVVRASASAAAGLIQLKNKHSFVQYLGDYEPVYRLSPHMREMRNGPPETIVAVTVQVITGRGARRTINELKALAHKFIMSHRVLNYHNVQLEVPAGRLADVARMANVFAVEELGVLQKTDEAQGQIVAGNLSGNAPTGPGYLSFLASVGFSSSQFKDFAVNVVDDAPSLTDHPDLPDSRIAFQNNPSNQTGPQSGHGFLNAHVIGGFNDGAGSAYEDSSGFNYGLGIAPFARVGVTAIFGPTTLAIGSWESTAYNQKARISSNSWSRRDTASTQPITFYDMNAQTYDSIVRDAQPGTPGLQQMIVVFGAGNGGPNGGTVWSPGTAKNVITVGASESVRAIGSNSLSVPDTCGSINNTDNIIADNANDVANFSSRGPINTATDGRIKPDILAPGTHIVAGVPPESNYDGSGVCRKYFPENQKLYGLSSGASQATPTVAGAAALVYQSFINNGLSVPSPAMMKAYLMNSTTYMTGAGANDTLPSNNQGMGRLDLTRAFNGQARLFWDQHLILSETGQTFQVAGSVHIGSRPLRITLAWTDAPGPTTGAPYVNNLDLEVTINGVTYRGNVFSGENSVSGGNADIRNNVESIFLPAGTVGNFTVTVRATNIAGDGVPGNGDLTDQDFALLISNAFFSPPTSPGNLVATASSATQVNLAWSTSLGTFDHYQVERSQNINSPYILVGSNVNTTSFTDAGAGSGITYLYRVRAADAANTSFSGYSNIDLATTIIFTDDPLFSGAIVKAQHFTELRQAVNAVRTAANLSLFNWTEVIQPGVTIKAAHIQELRDNLNLARNALGFSAQPYTDNPIGSGVTIKKAHVDEIWQGVK